MNNERKRLKAYIDEYFYYILPNKREEMLNKLLSFGNNSTIYIQIYNNNVHRIGVKYQIGEIKGKFYYSTRYDNEIFDL